MQNETFMLLVAAAVVALSGFAAAQASSRTLVLEHATIIDGTGAPALKDRTLVIRDGRIVQITGNYKAKPGERVVDLRGRYVLPGFINTHAHVTFLRDSLAADPESTYDERTTRRVLKLVLAFGQTTVRNPSAPAREGVRLREALARGDVVGPVMQTSGWSINNARLMEAEVREEVSRQAALGVDYIKVYAALPAPLVRAAIEEAHAAKIRVVGHLQTTTWTEAAQLGIDTITHGAPWSVEYLPADKREAYRTAQRTEGAMKARILWLEWVDLQGPEIQEMIKELRQRRIPVDPTLIAYVTKFRGDDESYIKSADLKLAPEPMLATWTRGTFTSDWTPDDYRRGRAAWPKLLRLTKLYFDSGVLLTAGDDLPNPWVVPGVAFHRELELLVEAGIPPLDVIKIATRNGAESMGILGEVGTVEAGKRADLVILRADPLRAIRNTRNIEAVIQRGKWIQPKVLVKEAGK